MSTKHIVLTILLTVMVNINISAQDSTQVGLPEGAIARLGKGGINLMRFSPDGTQLAVGTDIGVWLYEVPSGNETALINNLPGQVNALAFSQDGKILASSGDDNRVIQLWDVENRSKYNALTLSDTLDSISGLAFYGTTLISLDRLGEIIYWNVDTGNLVSQTGRVNSYDAVVFSDDGNTLAIGTDNSKIQIWDITTGELRTTMLGHARLFKNEDNEIWTLAFSPDGKTLASGGEDKTIKVWDIEKSIRITTLRNHTGWITALAFSKDGKTLVSGDANKVLRFWDMETEQERESITGHKNTINALTFSPESTPQYGECLASSSANGSIHLWNPENGEKLATLASGHTEWVETVAFSENDDTLTSVSYNGVVDVWSLKTHQEVANFTDGHSDVSDVSALSPNATFFARNEQKGMIAFSTLGFGSQVSYRNTNKIQLWNITTGEEKPILLNPVDFNRITAVTFSTNNILAIGFHREIRGVDVNTGTELFQLKSQQPLSIRGTIVFSDDGKRIAFVRPPRAPQVWDISTQKDITPSHIKEARAFAFAPDSSTVALANRQGIFLQSLDIENVDSAPLISEKIGRFIEHLKFSPNGLILVSVVREFSKRSIRLWDAKTGRYLGNLTGHTEPIETVVFSHDGKTLATGSQDGTILLWDWERIIEMYTR